MCQFSQMHFNLKRISLLKVVYPIFFLLTNNCLSTINEPNAKDEIIDDLLRILSCAECNFSNSPAAANPTFSPPPSSYNTTQTVTLATSTVGATICYTTDLSTPNCNLGSCTHGTTYSAPFLISATTTVNALSCSAALANSVVIPATYNFDTTAPFLLSSNPANSAIGVAVCTGSPCSSKIVLVFSESMDPITAQTLTTGIHNGSSFVSTPNTNTTFTWSTTTYSNDTLTLNISWHWFPEKSQIQWSLAIPGLRDVAGNAIATAVTNTFTTTAPPPSFPVADTGQLLCSSGANGDLSMLTCPQTIAGQDADSVNKPAARSFTGPTLNGASDYTTKDNTTNLVWKSCTEGLSGPTCSSGMASSMNWYNAVNQCAALNTANAGAGYANIKSWRLPSSYELESIANLGNSIPAIDASYFPATISGATDYYWSSTTYLLNQADALDVGFRDGDSFNDVKTTISYVRCVSSGPPAASSSFNDNGDGTVTDARTGLVWQQCSRGQSGPSCGTGTATNDAWMNSISYCNGLSLAGKTWRLPSRNELISIADRSKSTAPTIDTVIFPNSVSYFYWSSTTLSNGTSNAFYVNFQNSVSSYTVKSTAYRARCVAGP